MPTQTWRELTGDLPFGSVLGPYAHTKLGGGDANALMQLYDTRTKILPSLGNFGVCQPDISGLPSLGGGVPWPPAQRALVGAGLPGILEKVVEGLHVGF